MTILFIEREYSDNVTLSHLSVFDTQTNTHIFKCKGVELPWRDNQRNISCFPEGFYVMKKRWSPRFGNHFKFLDVPNRSYILIHRGNFVSDLRGCLAVGDSHRDINGDGILDVTNSVATMNKLNEVLPKEFVSIVYKKDTSPFSQF